jgi:hypothetical protein
MSIWKLLTDLIEAEHNQADSIRALRRENLDMLLEQRELLRKQEVLNRENLRISREVRADAENLTKFVAVALPILAALQQAVVPEPVASIQLSGDKMDIKAGQSSTLTFVASGASGNPTVPVGTPAFNSTNTSDFTVTPAADNQSAVLTVNGTPAAGATTDVTVVVDGVTSNAVTYNVVTDTTGGGGTTAEPVTSVVLTGSQPA